MKQEIQKLCDARELARLVHADIHYMSGDVKRYQLDHIQEVANLVWMAGGSYVEVTAAWLHDTLEHTNTTKEDLDLQFNENIVQIVQELSDDKSTLELSIKNRKDLQTEYIKKVSNSAKLIKVADQISNVRSLYLLPRNDRSSEQNMDYLTRARIIVNACSNVNTFLDKVFKREYGIAKNHIKKVT